MTVKIIDPPDKPADAKLHFNEENHRYWLGGRELFSVTRVLRLTGLVDARWFSADVAWRGTRVHQALEYADHQNDLDETTIDPLVAPYVAAYRRFLADARPVWTLIEARLHDEVLGYAGTVDRYGLVQGIPTVLEIKTGSPAPWHSIQLAAYTDLLHTQRVVLGRPSRMGLYLMANGYYTTRVSHDRQDFTVFRAALTLAHWRHAHGLDRD